MNKRTTKPPALTDEQARLIGTFGDMVEDALRATASIASRASDRLNGQPGTLEFHAAERAVMGLLESPEFKALRSLGIPPSMLTVGAKPKGGKGNG